MFEDIVLNIQVFFLIFARITGVIRVAPLISSTAVPQAARNGLALLAAFVVFPQVVSAGYPIPPYALQYGALVLGEALIGVIIGFFLVVVFSAFQLSAQFFSLQMGFGASEVFDPLAQVEIPVMGQFLNLIAMFIFLSVGGFSKLFLVGVRQSFAALTAAQLAGSREFVFGLFMNSLGQLFEQAMVISFPIFGSMFLVQITLGLLAKAAPQMNLLTLGFPISTTIAFLVLFMTLPFITEAFASIIDGAFEQLLRSLDAVWKGSA